MTALGTLPLTERLGAVDIQRFERRDDFVGRPEYRSVLHRCAACAYRKSADKGDARYGGIPRVLSPGDTEKFVADSVATYSKLGRDLGIELK